MALKITKNQGSIQVTADQSGFYPFDGTITFPTNSLFTATSANTDMITFKSTSNGDVQFVGNYKDITISGRSYDTKQKFLTAFSNLANQGSVDAYTKAETDAKIDAKQGKLKAGNGITLTEDATDNTTVVKTAVSLTDNGNGAYQVGDKIEIGSDTVTIGKGAISRSKSSIAIGKSATSDSGTSNVAIGTVAISSGGSSVAIGDKVETSNISTIAIGTLAGAYSRRSIAIGYNAKASADTPMVINAGSKTMIQSDANGKISLLKGDGTDERMVIQDEIEALKNAGGGGTVDAYTKAETDTKLETKQDKLTAGSGITITKDETAGTSTIATAVSLTDNGNGAYEVGDSIKMEREGIAIGMNANGRGSSLVAIGNNANGYGNESVAIGNGTSVEGPDNVVIGTFASSISSSGVAIGYNSRTNSKNSVAIGYYSRADENTPLVIKAGYKTVGSNEQPLTVLQSDATGKLSILKGDGTDERIVIQDEIEALKNAGGGGTIDAYTKAETDNLLNAKQNTLTAGTGITIDENNVISSTGGSGGGANPYVNVKGTDSAIISENLTNAIAIGSDAKVSQENGVAIGSGTKAFGGKSVAVGYQTSSQGEFSVGIGSGAMASGTHGIAVGYRASSVDDISVAIGSGAMASAHKPMVINAGGKTMIQGDANGKISVLLGDGTDTRIVISDEFAALKAEITTLKAEIAALKGGA